MKALEIKAMQAAVARICIFTCDNEIQHVHALFLISLHMHQSHTTEKLFVAPWFLGL